jgi:succinoglycan biosynthesis transport protein ExoP
MNAIEPRPIKAPVDPQEFALADHSGWQSSVVTKVLAIARKRKWVLIGTVIAALLIGLLMTLLATPLYTARTTIEIRRETPTLSTVQAQTDGRDSANDQEFYQTQYGLLVAQSLGDRVASDLRLAESPAFLRAMNSKMADVWFDGEQPRSNAPSRAARIRIIGSMLINGIDISPERNSRLVNISYTSPDPAMSKRVVDAWGAGYIQTTLDRRFETTSYARNFLEKRLAQLRGRIDETERQLVDYASRQGIVNIPGPTSSGPEGGSTETPLIATDLAVLNAELAKATADRITAQSRTGRDSAVSSEAITNPTIATLRAQRAELSGNYAKLMQQFEPQYGPALALQRQIRSIDKAVADEQARVGGSLDGNYQSSLARETELKQRVDGLKTSFLDLRRRTIQYDILQRDVDTNRQLYAALLQRYKEIGVAGGVGINNISIVDPAEMPTGPSSPSLLKNLAIALLLGMVLASALVFLLEIVDVGISDPGEVPQVLRVPLLGMIPISEDDVEDLLLDPKSAVSEAYFSLQTTLRLSTDHGFPRSIVVTSSRPGEGKSTTSYALARSLTQLGRRVLLIDADMRSPSVHRMTRLSNVRGLSNYLSGEDDVSELIQTFGVANMFVMAAGPQPPSAAELLASDRLATLVSELTVTFDFIVIDGPPVMGIADAPLIGSCVEGTVFVIEAHATTKGTARVAITRMQASHVPILGAVLTKFNMKRANYGYGYDYGYGYGYGDPSNPSVPATSPSASTTAS